MKKYKLNYRFHNCNTVEATADYITKLFIEVNSHKVEEAIKSAADETKDEECYPQTPDNTLFSCVYNQPII